jgi:diketogulonate reductase-like aldo/keto reductase
VIAKTTKFEIKLEEEFCDELCRVHPFNQQVKAHDIMMKYGVHIQAWAPFAESKNNLFGNKTLKAV